MFSELEIAIYKMYKCILRVSMYSVVHSDLIYFQFIIPSFIRVHVAVYYRILLSFQKSPKTFVARNHNRVYKCFQKLKLKLKNKTFVHFSNIFSNHTLISKYIIHNLFQ